MRYLLSLLIPVPMRSTYHVDVAGRSVQTGGAGNHFRDDDHLDRVSVAWWQWRGHCLRQRTTATCIGG